MAELKLFKGGEFLITDALPEEVFTPEDFTNEQRLIAKSAEEFGLGELAPRRDELEELNEELLKSLLRSAGELGLLSTDMPEIYGGSELDKVSSVLVTEKINQGIGGFLLAYGVQTGIGSLPIVFFGTPEQKKKYLPKLASGEMIGAYALTESAHGSDALTAEKMQAFAI
ncbi:MAG: acyl-CoA dehydrogenase family protein [Deltaproteobacteria bacterium]|nr:acyl-CoA dehydrogenase family protein [Deltaproteobacteria bacterium]